MGESSFIPVEVVEYMAELFAAGVRGRGVSAGEGGMPRLWLFGQPSFIPWW